MRGVLTGLRCEDCSEYFLAVFEGELAARHEGLQKSAIAIIVGAVAILSVDVHFVVFSWIV
jgi:hypothetical protein